MVEVSESKKAGGDEPPASDYLFNYTVGKFRAFQFKDETAFSVAGPEQYMNEQGNALCDRIIAGDDLIFNMCAHQSPNLYIAVLVRLQTDYAGWRGYQEALAWLRQ